MITYLNVLTINIYINYLFFVGAGDPPGRQQDTCDDEEEEYEECSMSTTSEDFNVDDESGPKITNEERSWFDAYDSKIPPTPTSNEPDPVPSTVVVLQDDNTANLIPSESNMIVPATHGMGPLEQPLPADNEDLPTGKKQKTSDAKPMEDDISYFN